VTTSSCFVQGDVVAGHPLDELECTCAVDGRFGIKALHRLPVDDIDGTEEIEDHRARPLSCEDNSVLIGRVYTSEPGSFPTRRAGWSRRSHWAGSAGFYHLACFNNSSGGMPSAAAICLTAT
jgi:hypothetical protein